MSISFLIAKKICFGNRKKSACTLFLKLTHVTHFEITRKCAVLKKFTEGNTRKMHLLFMYVTSQ